MRRRRPRPGDKWHLDEVFIQIEGFEHHLWRSVDQNGICSTSLLSHDARLRCEALLQQAVKALQYVPRVVVTDKLKSYRVARRDCFPRWNFGKAGI